VANLHPGRNPINVAAIQSPVTDNVGIELVEFWRLNGVNQEWIGINTFSSPPYQASVEVNALNLGWNQMFARVKDTAGNYAAESTFIYRLMPEITLDTTKGPIDTQVTVRGSGWLPEDTVIISLADPANEVTQATVDNAGNFTARFTVPANAAIGEQKVIAITANGFWETDAIFQVTEPGRLRVIKALSMPTTSPFVGGSVTASFTVKNVGGSTLYLEELTAGARRGRAWNGEWADFPHVFNITLQPNEEEYVYEQSRSFDTAGNYFAEPVVKINGQWGGIENANRVPFTVQM
jgi:hypothetical protein